MHALFSAFGRDEMRLAFSDVEPPAVDRQRRCGGRGAARLGGGDKQVLTLGIETPHCRHYPFAPGQLLQQFAAGVVEIQMIVAVALALPDELLWIIRKEEHRMLRLDVAAVRLGEQVGFLLAGEGRVAHEMHLVLLAVKLGDVYALFVGAPGNVREVFLPWQSRLQPDGLFA